MSVVDREAAMMELLKPDGYYAYLGIKKERAAADAKEAAPIDEDLVKKNYRKLSLKHHPDKGGDADTFRVLNRAYRVLKDPKLRQQYDMLGIDLDEDEHAEDDDDNGKDSKEASSSQGIIQDIAGSVLTFMIQLGVRTLMMGSASVVFVRYKLTLYPLLAFLAFIVFRIIQQQSRVPGGSLMDTLPATSIAAGLLLMHSSIDTSDETAGTWNKMFWLGEALVIGMFCHNSLPFPPPHNKLILTFLTLFAVLAALGLRGKFWNYATVLIVILVLAVLVALAFPMIEILLEAIINEKLKKVGDKLRHQHAMQEKYFKEKFVK